MRQLGILAVALTSLLAGCGKAANPLESLPHESSTIPVTPPGMAVVLPGKSSEPTPAPVVGTVVDGRVYNKADAPKAPSATPTPAAPAAGLGHLHVKVDLAFKLARVVSMRVLVVNKDHDLVFEHTFQSSDLIGEHVDTTATNLAPGDYAVQVVTYNNAGKQNAEYDGKGAVSAGKSVDVSI
ncbi:MAG TPA: hypothetical protein V6D47_00700 [Oscillatoriaceae cyanobacterium]